MLHRCKLCKVCPHCGADNGTVKKAAGVYKILHDKYKGKSNDLSKGEFAMAIKYNDGMEKLISKVMVE